MGKLHRRSEAELAGLDDGSLVDYVAAAREEGDEEAAQLGLRIFAFGMQDRLLAFVKLRMEGRSETEIEEVAGRSLEDALRSIEKLRGSSEAEARAFVFRIAKRRIADFFRANRLEVEALEVSGGPGDGLHPDVAARSLAGESDAVDTQLLITSCLEELRPDHREVVELCLFAGFSAREAVDRVNGRDSVAGDDPLSEQNAHQIVSRFRKDLRQRLEDR